MADSSCHTNNKTKTVTTSSSSNNNNAKEMGIGKREKNGASYFGFEQVTQMQSNGKRMANNNLSSVSFYHRYCCCCWNFTWHTFPTTFSNLPLIHSSPRTFYVKKKMVCYAKQSIQCTTFAPRQFQCNSQKRIRSSATPSTYKDTDSTDFST